MTTTISDEQLAQLEEIAFRDTATRVTVKASELRGLIARLRAAEADAKRYRWLRSQPNDFSAPRIDICHWQRNGDDSVNEGEGLRLEEADKAIDAAMERTP